MKSKIMHLINTVKDKCVNFNSRVKDSGKFILFLVCAVIVIYIISGLVPYLVSVMVGYRVENSDNEIITEISSGDLYTYNDNILLFDSNGMKFYDMKGRFKHNLYFDAYAPYLDIKGNIIAVADTNGKSSAVIKNNKIKYTLKTVENVQLVSVNKKAYSSLITNEKGYKSLVEVYDSDGDNIYQWHIGEHYAVDACVTDNNKYLAVLSVGIDDSNISSYVTFINLKEDVVHSEYKIENELAYKMTVGKNEAYVISDRGVYCVSSSGKVRYKYGFSGKELFGFDLEDKNNIALALNENNSESMIILLNKRLKTKGECPVPIQVTMLDAGGGRIAVAGQNEVYITEKNRIYAKGIFSGEAERMKFSENKKHIITSGGNNISIYDVKLGR